MHLGYARVSRVDQLLDDIETAGIDGATLAALCAWLQRHTVNAPLMEGTGVCTGKPHSRRSKKQVLP